MTKDYIQLFCAVNTLFYSKQKKPLLVGIQVAVNLGEGIIEKTTGWKTVEAI